MSRLSSQNDKKKESLLSSSLQWCEHRKITKKKKAKQNKTKITIVLIYKKLFCFLFFSFFKLFMFCCLSVLGCMYFCVFRHV